MAKKSEMIGFKTTPEIRKALESIAEKEDRSMSYIINRILTEYFTQQSSTESVTKASNNATD